MRVRKDVAEILGPVDERVGYVDVRYLPSAICIVIAFGVALFTVLTFATPSKTETAYYERTCDTLAGKTAHYTHRVNGSAMVCSIVSGQGTTHPATRDIEL